MTEHTIAPATPEHAAATTTIYGVIIHVARHMARTNAPFNAASATANNVRINDTFPEMITVEFQIVATNGATFNVGALIRNGVADIGFVTDNGTPYCVSGTV